MLVGLSITISIMLMRKWSQRSRTNYNYLTSHKQEFYHLQGGAEYLINIAAGHRGERELSVQKRSKVILPDIISKSYFQYHLS